MIMTVSPLGSSGETVMVMEVSVVAVPEAWIWLGVLDTGVGTGA